MEVALGVAVALGMILLGNALEGGHFGSILGGSAAMIVLGGTIGAVLVQFPLATVKGALAGVAATLKKPKHDPAHIVDEIVDYANRARKDGILSLEKAVEQASHPFLAKALTMAIDGVDSDTLRDMMEQSLAQAEEHGEDAAKVFEAGGGFSPTIGIIGAVLGLIHVMSNLSDINAVGTGIAAAFVATIYGVGVANIFFLPLAGRIKLRVREEAALAMMMLQGVLAIQAGMNPKLVRERLAQFAPHGKGAPAAQGAGVPAKAAG